MKKLFEDMKIMEAKGVEQAARDIANNIHPQSEILSAVKKYFGGWPPPDMDEDLLWKLICQHLISELEKLGRA